MLINPKRLESFLWLGEQAGRGRLLALGRCLS